MPDKTESQQQLFDVKVNEEGEVYCDSDTCIRHGVGTLFCPLERFDSVAVADDQFSHYNKPWVSE